MSRFFISAGETSGDLHAATVVAELKLRFPDADIAGIAGQQMQLQGCRPLHHMHELNVMGITDVLRSLPRIRGIEKSVLGWCAEQRPDVAVLVDFSSFHMRLGRKLRELGIPVVHFIAPKLWAWGSHRVRKLKQSQDRLACILPFEADWFKSRGIAHAEYVGNPSAAAELKQRLGIDENQPLLALLPGSRPQEIRAHVPVLVETLQQIQQQMPDIACVVPLAPGVKMDALEPLWQQGAQAIQRMDKAYALRADAAVAVSGTATLELALWDTPTVLIYKASPLMMFLARRLVKLNCAGLANIVLGDKEVIPELLQEDVNVDKILTHLIPLIRNGAAADIQHQEFARLWDLLGHQQPSTGVVDMVADLLESVAK
ncbi:MAG: lipid-A-disaccharide synthase [Mariprofundus sp.]